MIDKIDFKLKGRLTVNVLSDDGSVIETIDLGNNTIMPRSRLVASRLFAQNLKAWTTAGFQADWTAYAGQDYLGGTDVGSYNYPFSEDVYGLGNSLSRLDVFGGVPTSTDVLTGDVVALIDQNTNRCYWHEPTGAAVNAAILMSLGITGMSFGNMGHLVDPSDVTANANDSNGLVATDYNPAASHDIPTLPAEPYDATTPGYSWPGGGTVARYPNLHQPNAFSYEPVLNGVVPWGYSGLATVTDNRFTVQGGNPAMYEGNSALFSETGRYPLDRDDGVSFPDGSSVQFKCTVPADSEINQERNYGYGQRPRNWITEAGLITGENIIVQSPDDRAGVTVDPTSTGVSNINGAQLTSAGTFAAGAYRALPKDYFSRLRDPLNAIWFLDSDGQLNSSHNNTWNLVARKVFGVITKTQAVAYSFLWTISFG